MVKISLAVGKAQHSLSGVQLHCLQSKAYGCSGSEELCELEVGVITTETMELNVVSEEEVLLAWSRTYVKLV